MIGHHNTYTNVDGIYYQILIEADFLVNLHEDNVPKEGIMNAYKKIFKTEVGKKSCCDMYGIDWKK